MPINHFHFEAVDSTQDKARELIGMGYDLPILVTADRQVQGRGRQARTWESPPGNFYGSLMIDPKISPRHYHEYSFAMALVLRDVIAGMTDQPVTLKWPNDILLDCKKCAGILIESDGVRNEFLIIGIGVNLYSAPDYAAALWPAQGSEGRNQQTEEFLQILIKYFSHWQNIYLTQGFDTIRAQWLCHAHGLQGEIQVRTPNETHTGIFSGIDENGTLLLTQGAQTIKVTTADVMV